MRNNVYIHQILSTALYSVSVQTSGMPVSMLVIDALLCYCSMFVI